MACIENSAGAAPGGDYNKETSAVHVCVYTKGPELHLECVYTTEATSASGLVWKQKLVLILDLPTLKRPVLHSDLFTHFALASPGLVCTTKFCVAPGRLSSTGPELNLVLCGQQ